MSESDFLAYQRATARGLLAEQRDGGVGVQARLFDERDWPLEGRIDFIDNQVDRGAGTIRVRAIFDNPTMMLTPGQFGRLRLPGSERYTATLLPDSAIVSDQSSKIVLTVARGRHGCAEACPSRPDRGWLADHPFRPDPTDASSSAACPCPARLQGDAAGRRDPEPAARSQRAMKFSHFFIDRPVFATVLSILIS